MGLNMQYLAIYTSNLNCLVSARDLMAAETDNWLWHEPAFDPLLHRAWAERQLPYRHPLALMVRMPEEGRGCSQALIVLFLPGTYWRRRPKKDDRIAHSTNGQSTDNVTRCCCRRLAGLFRDRL